MLKCKICSAEKVEILAIKGTDYLTCSSCKSICMDERSFITVQAQRERYEQHNNSLNDEGYLAFLEKFIIPVLKEVQEHNSCNKNIKTILDYGSGPAPALCSLLKRYAEKGELLSTDCEIRGWDPFFAPETVFFNGGADLVTCLEVAEHFENPLADMKKLASAVKKGGFAAIGTMLLPAGCVSESDGTGTDAFRNWWYRSDSTHVAFYSLEGLIRCAESAGLEFVKAVTDRAFLFRKKA